MQYQSERAAVILAGGDGIRLRDFTRAIFGEEMPKQFCPLLGAHTLLEQTRRRAALLVEPARTLTIFTASHERYFQPLIPEMGGEQIVVQPHNRGTAPAILYSLMRLKKVAPDSTVALFPSDHSVDNDRAFMRNVEAAFRAVDARPEETVLLGIEPDNPEPQYGWIEPGAVSLQRMRTRTPGQALLGKTQPGTRAAAHAHGLPMEQFRYSSAAFHFPEPLSDCSARASRGFQADRVESWEPASKSPACGACMAGFLRQTSPAKSWPNVRLISRCCG